MKGMLKMADDRNCRHELSLPGLYWYFWTPFFGAELHKNLCSAGITLNPFALEKAVAPAWIFFAVSFAVDREP